MSGARRHDGQSGFTLVEVLISLFIFSLISTGAYLALASTLDAREASEARLEQIEALATMRRLMAEDVRHATLRRDRDGLGGFEDERLQAPDPERLRITRRGRPNPGGVFPRGDLLRVEWRVENGQLIRSFLPHENPARITDPIDRVVLDGVERMEVLRQFTPQQMASLSQEGDAQTAGVLSAAGSGGLVFVGETAQIGLVDIRLNHSDGTQTRHVFEWAPL